MLLQVFNQNITEGPGNGSYTSHSMEIIIMLLGAFLLGYLLRFFLNEKFKRKIRQLETEATKLKTYIASLEDNLAAVKHENDNLKAELDAAITKTIHLGHDINVIDGKLKTAEESNKNLNIWLEAANTKIKSMENTLSEINTKVSVLEQTNENIQADMEKYIASNNAMEAKIKTMQQGENIEKKNKNQQ